MPTENRSSNTEMVSVPRELLQRIDRMYTDGMSIFGECEEVRAIMALPAEQHQRAPVALPARKPSPTEESDVFTDAENSGFNDCLGEIAKLGPLYTHADPGEVGRLNLEIEKLRFSLACNDDALIQDDCVRTENRTLTAEVERLQIERRRMDEALVACANERYSLRAQLAEAQALLREIHDGALSGFERYSKIEALLSASAEPKAIKQETHAEMRIRHKREFDALDGSGFHYEECRCGTRGSYPVEVKHCACGKAFASAEPSAPVERDERAEFERAYQRAVDHGWSNVKHLARQLWNARADLERKP